jgi:hypothetical protein
MPRSRRFLSLVHALSNRRTADSLSSSPTALIAVAVLALGSTSANAQSATARAQSATANSQAATASDKTLHLAASRFEFVVSGDTQPPARPLRVHNGGTVRFTDVRLVRLAYADPARGTGWLVALPRQTTVAPDELAIVGTLCVNPAGLRAGTYRATAAVAAREVPEPVEIAVTLVVTDAGARARRANASCVAAAK